MMNMRDKKPGKTFRSRDRWLHLARKTGLVALLAGATYLALVAVAPYLISSTVVRSSMEQAVSTWTGHDATIEGTPQIAFWPEPRITLADVTISKMVDGQRRIMGRVERLSAEFGFLSALRGSPVFHDFTFYRPQLFVTRDMRGRLDWANEGLLSAAVRGVAPRDGDRQTLGEEFDAPVGSVTVEDGTVEVIDQVTGRRLKLDDISADVSWPRLSDEMKGIALLNVGGHDLRLDINTRQPLLLLGGQSARTRVAVRSDAVSGSFDGIANLLDGYSFSGALELSAADIPALIGWTGVELPEMRPLKAGSLKAQLTTVADNLRLSDLSFTFNDISATGILELSRPKDAKPRISGTLAFDQLDIGALFGAFSLHLPTSNDTESQTPDGLLAALDFDLTLSARQAALQPFVLEDVAASVLTRGGKAKFDIADSRFEGGRLTGHFDGSGRGFEDGGNLMISARDADLQSMARRLSLKGPVPDARGTLDLTIHSARPLWSTRLQDIDGTFRLRAGQGTIAGLDLPGIRSLSGERAYFRLSEAGDDGLAFNQLEIATKFGAGSAEIDKAELLTANEKLSLTGIIPYASNSLALAGEIAPTSSEAAPAANEALRFFIGGSWPDPILSPILMPPEKM